MKRLIIRTVLFVFVGLTFLVNCHNNEKKPKSNDGIVDKVYLINLDRSPDRLQKMKEEFEKVDMSFSRFSAVDGRELNIDKVKIEWNYNETEFSMSKGEFGCYLSHIDVLKEFLAESSLEKAMIVEDDVRFESNFPGKLADLIKHAPRDWDILYLGCYYGMYGNKGKSFDVTSDGRFYILDSGMCAGTYAYIVNSIGAEKIVLVAQPLNMPIDLMIGSRLFEQQLVPFRAYCATGSVATHDASIESTIDELGRETTS